ncbi:MAG: dihydroxy-acid dehydratase, partial [Quisquiliibacterium sp.]
LTLMISDQELSARQQKEPVTSPSAPRGYRKLFLERVTQADEGADFDFLRGQPDGRRVPR